MHANALFNATTELNMSSCHMTKFELAFSLRKKVKRILSDYSGHLSEMKERGNPEPYNCNAQEDQG